MDFAMMQAVYYRTVELSHIEVAVLFALAGAAKDSKTRPSPSLYTIANRAALSTRSVSRSIKSLGSKGIITVDKRQTENGQFCNEYCVDCAKLKASAPNDYESNMDCESNNNRSLYDDNNRIVYNHIHNKTHDKTQGGSLEGGDEGSKLIDKTHTREPEPRDLEGIFEVLRKEYKQEFPFAAQFVNGIITTETHGSELYPKLLKELRDQESNGWLGIRSPLKLVRARLRGYVPYSLMGDLKFDLSGYKFVREEAMKCLKWAERCNNIGEIHVQKMKNAEAEKGIVETEKHIAEIANKIKEYQDIKRKRESAVWPRQNGARGL